MWDGLSLGDGCALSALSAVLPRVGRVFGALAALSAVLPRVGRVFGALAALSAVLPRVRARVAHAKAVVVEELDRARLREQLRLPALEREVSVPLGVDALVAHLSARGRRTRSRCPSRVCGRVGRAVSVWP
eukprot:1063831-Prymnesium_polylepis.2